MTNSLPIIESPTSPQSEDAGVAGAKGRFAFVTLGCPKNLVDSERMLGLLAADGYELTTEAAGSDFIVVNTCGFIEPARVESMAAIDDALAMKRDGATQGVIVAGCLAERKKDELLAARPEIDQILGVFGRDEITATADRFLGRLEEQRTVFRPAPANALSDRRRMRITPRHFAYLKISEGCDRLCTFCAIPKMRGKHVSKPIEEVIAEAEELVADGVRELVIVAQDTTYYGLDLYGETRLAELLARLVEVPGLDWIRLMYLYPMHFTEPLIELLSAGGKVIPYLDMPLQHASDAMLKRMQRRVTRGATEDLLGRLRQVVPDLVLRTTMITGFPGETEDDFEQLVDFVQRHRFERLGAFIYSLEPDTPAARLPNHLPEEVKNERRNALMEVQQQIAFDWAVEQQGRTIDVLLDSPLPEQPGVWLGRSYAEAPDVDPVVYVTGEDLRPGVIVPCEVVAAAGYDLAAAPVGDPR